MVIIGCPLLRHKAVPLTLLTHVLFKHNANFLNLKTDFCQREIKEEKKL